MPNNLTTQTCFLDDGLIPLDNNPAEDAIRPFVIGRKTWLFADTVHGAEASANIYSLMETTKANGLDPYRYLRHVFTHRPAAQSPEEIDALLPTRVNADFPSPSPYTFNPVESIMIQRPYRTVAKACRCLRQKRLQWSQLQQKSSEKVLVIVKQACVIVLRSNRKKRSIQSCQRLVDSIFPTKVFTKLKRPITIDCVAMEPNLTPTAGTGVQPLLFHPCVIGDKAIAIAHTVKQKVDIES